jgi:hypothetical protein
MEVTVPTLDPGRFTPDKELRCQLNPRVNLEVWEKKNYLPHPGFKLRMALDSSCMKYLYYLIFAHTYINFVF